MASPEPTLSPPPTHGRTISLPRMGRALELFVDARVVARVWWIDPNLLVLWSAEKLPTGIPLPAQLDLLGGGSVRVQVTVPEGQQLMKAEDGYVTLARYAPGDQFAARALSTSLLRINPRAFKPEYVPPKLPRTPPAQLAPKHSGPSSTQVALAVAGTAVLALMAFFMV